MVRTSPVIGVRDGLTCDVGEGWLYIDGFYANKFGKFYRSCGNCSQQFQRHVNITNFVGIGSVVGKLQTSQLPQAEH
jgi:hypothetical protein